MEIALSVIRIHESATDDIEIERANVSRFYRGTVIANVLPMAVLAMITLCRELPFLTGAAAVALVVATPPVARLIAPLGAQ